MVYPGGVYTLMRRRSASSRESIVKDECRGTASVGDGGATDVPWACSGSAADSIPRAIRNSDRMALLESVYEDPALVSPTRPCRRLHAGCHTQQLPATGCVPVSYTHLRAHETPEHLVCR